MSEPSPLRHLPLPPWVVTLVETLTDRRLPGRIEAGIQTAARILDALKLVDKITSGKSKVTFDAVTVGGADEAIRGLYVQHLRDLALTNAGFQMLSDLDKSPFKTTIQFMRGTNPHTNPPPGNTEGWGGKGSDATVTVNPFEQHVYPCKKQGEPWMSDSNKFSLYHELVHAWHLTRGTAATGTHGSPPHDVDNDEWQAVGLGPFQKEAISENVIRQQMGQPLRPNYGGATYDGQPC